MIEDLLKLKRQIDCMIETYKDLHPDSYEITGDGRYVTKEKYALMDNGEYITKKEYETHDRGNNTHLDGMSEYDEKQRALKKIREGTYESTFRKKQGKKTTKSSEGPPSLCVYGDS